MNYVGSKIKELRRRLGLSADDLAEKIGKNRATIFRYENGEIENMPIDVISAIAAALRTTPAELMGWNQEPPLDDDSYSEVQKAMELYSQYKQAIPQVQNAVDALLKSSQLDS